jgi:hypothetical protein
MEVRVSLSVKQTVNSLSGRQSLDQQAMQQYELKIVSKQYLGQDRIKKFEASISPAHSILHNVFFLRQ